MLFRRYVTGLNTAEEQFAEALAAKDVKKQISLQPALKFNGGGESSMRNQKLPS